MWLAASSAVAAAFEAVSGFEVDGAFGDPADEFGDFWVGAEGFDGGELAGEFGFGEEGVDFAVADGVEDGDGAVFAAFQFWGEVVFALELRWDFAFTEGADVHGGTSNVQLSTFNAQL